MLENWKFAWNYDKVEWIEIFNVRELKDGLELW